VSLPVIVTDNTFNVLFPDAAGAGVFRYAGGYQSVTQLQPCEGYWLKLNTGGTYNIPGTTVDQCDTTAPVGWNILGVPVDGVTRGDITQAPTGNIASVFGYAGGYVAKTDLDLLEMGQGFWFKLNNPGQLVMDSAPGGITPKLAGIPGRSAHQSISMLTASKGDSRQELLLGAEVTAISEMPPLPPAGSLDLRVAVGNASTNGVPLTSEQMEYRLQIQGTDRLGWDMQPTAGSQWQLVVDGETHVMVGRGSLSFNDTPGDVRLLFNPTPTQFSLKANYPNPFNPSTTIGYEIAEASQVTLTIYGMLGQKVSKLVDQKQQAGSYSVVWDGRNSNGHQVANGVYFYEIQAGSYHSVRRMMLTK